MSSGPPLEMLARQLTWVAFFMATLLAISAMPVFALASDNPDLSSPTAQAPAPSAEETAEAERKEREHVEWLSSPEAARQRNASRSAYGQLSTGQARDLLLESFPAQLEALNADPGRLLAGLDVKKVLGAHTVRVAVGDGESALLESSARLQSSLGGEGAKPVDLTLERSESGFVSRNPSSEVTLPDSAGGSIEMESGVNFQLPASANPAAELLGEMNLFYPEALPATDTVISPTAEGVEVFEQLRSPDSPENFRFQFELPRAYASGTTSLRRRPPDQKHLNPPGSTTSCASATNSASTSISKATNLRGTNESSL